MTYTKKSASSSSSPANALKKEVHAKEINPPNAIPYKGGKRPERHLYGGMLFPSRVIAAKEVESRDRDLK